MIEIECSLEKVCSSKCSKNCLNCKNNQKENYFDYYSPKNLED